GIADFESRFQRKPEGMWLPETAVDLESLQVLAEEGIRFTILAPHQAERIRKIKTAEEDKEDAWIDVNGEKIDPSRPYRCLLPGGLSIDLFFYDGPLSHGVAFDKLLHRGEAFVERLRSGFSDKRDWPQLLHIATDGESYGHHSHHGDMALAYTLQQFESQQTVKLTNYGEYLSKNPPSYEVEIVEKSSWSCPHGVERWRSDCGCQSGGRAGWNQKWRRPLREGLDGLKESLDLLFQTRGEKWFKDPWETRNAYISLIRKREQNRLDLEEFEAFLSQYQRGMMTLLEREAAVKLLEMQRNALLMFTSCAWFWDDISGYETTQVLQYAGRAIQLAKEIDGAGWGGRVEGPFLEKLKEAKSNIAEQGDGAAIYQNFIRTATADIKRIIAHFAIPSIFDHTPQNADLYGYRMELQDYQRVTDGTITLAIGKGRLTSKITFEIEEAIFGTLHFGGHDFHCAVGALLGTEEYERMKSDLIRKFFHDSQAAVVRCMDHYFGEDAHTLQDLFLETRRKVLGQVADALFGRYENVWRQIYLDHRKLMLYLQSTQAKIPKPFLAPAAQVLNYDLRREISHLPDPSAFDRVAQIFQESQRWGVEMETEKIERRMREMIEAEMRRLLEQGGEGALEAIHRLLDVADQSRIKINLWEAQNLFQQFLNQRKKRRGETGASSASRRDRIVKLAERLSYHTGGIS
ncbi:MAG TPA: DUF3536 domain-containing protein, partial [Candidatus Manganitrophaceae bacterium]|nr:DUF3536 domain-containing protein [Candidatus Manganitrophaceae bacterium]